VAGAIKRNDPCPCGSGRKYKSCCGAPGAASPAPAGGAARGAAAARPAAPSEAQILAAAMQMHRAGQLGPAEARYRAVLAKRPRDVNALMGLGQLRGELGFHEEAIDLVRRAIAEDGRPAQLHIVLADLLQRVGRYADALTSARRAASIEPRNAAAHTLVAICLDNLNRVDEAMAAIHAALAIAPRDANAAIIAAQIERRRGDIAGARARLEAIVARTGIDPYLHELALQRLGMVLDDLGETDLAWAAFVQSGREQKASPRARRVDAGLWSRRIRRDLDGLTPELVRRSEVLGVRDDLPVPRFIVGFSRSGTTMIEQVLAAHGRVVTTDEEPILRVVKERLFTLTGAPPRGDDVPAALRAIDARGLAELRGLYWREAESFAGGPLGDRVFVDKLPLNIIDAGLVNALFPEARLLVVLRDPRDVCLSCFMQWFGLHAANVRFLTIEDTVAFYAEVMDLWLHVRPMLSLRWLEVRYEDVVRDLEGQARRVVDLFGLDWDDALLRFHEKARTREISTPSAAAVTEGVHGRAVARWRRYEKHLAPVLPTLARFVQTFGYDR
jgi:tetratricopeptide (TPR) repeat protein